MNITAYFIRFFWDRVALVWGFYLLWTQNGLASVLVTLCGIWVGLTCALLAHRSLLESPPLIAYHSLLQDPVKRKFRYVGSFLCGLGGYWHFIPLVAVGATMVLYGHLNVPAAVEANPEKIPLFLWNRINRGGRQIARFLQW